MDRLSAAQKEKRDLKSVLKSGLSIQNLTDPSEAVQLAAVRKNPFAIKYIQAPSEAVQMAAIQKKNAQALMHIQNPSDEVQLAAVQIDGSLVMHINNPSEAVLKAMRQSAHALLHLQEAGESVQLAAIQADFRALAFCVDDFCPDFASFFSVMDPTKNNTTFMGDDVEDAADLYDATHKCVKILSSYTAAQILDAVEKLPALLKEAKPIIALARSSLKTVSDEARSVERSMPRTPNRTPKSL